jgi:putative hemolysin
MATTVSTPREISYASGAETRAGRAIIRSIENLTGRPRLIRMAADYQADVASGRDFWEVMQERYRLTFEIPDQQFNHIPPDGPLVLIANHPFGILDGLAMGRILSMTRGDFKIIAHRVFRRAKELDEVILPISFDGDKEATRTNVETRRTALDYLANGGAIGIFPGGTVSTSATLFGRPMDPAWRTFTARLIARSDATVVPVYFDGANSRFFQLMSHIHSTLRLALLIKEFGSRVGDVVPAVIGAPLPRSEIDARLTDARALMDYLREATYRLAPNPIEDLGYGHDFETD